MARDLQPSPPETPRDRPRRCPICGRPESAAQAPFCSTRCADVDLHRWFGGVYTVPAVEGDGTEQGGENE